MTPTPNKRNRSAACGAWSHGKDENGIEQHAHERMVECHREWQAERAMGNDETFAEWLKS